MYETVKTVKGHDISKAEALEELEKMETEIKELSGPLGRYYSVREYYVEEAEYDEDGNWVSGGDVWGYSRMTIPDSIMEE